MPVTLNKGKAFDSVNITSIMDMVFLLLIFFMVTSEFAKEKRPEEKTREHSIDVELPRASEAKPLVSVPTELYVNVDKDGRYFVNGRFMEIDEVEAVVKQSNADNPTRVTVAIRADKVVPFERVISVVNLCLKTGSSYRFATSNEDAAN